MGSEFAVWTECRVEDIAAPTKHSMSTGPFGSAISAKYFRVEGVPIIRGRNLSAKTSEKIIDERWVFVAPEKAKEHQRSLVRNGDLVFTCWGTIDQVGLIDASAPYAEFILSNKQMKLTPDTTKATALFLYYLFSNPITQERILRNDIGSTIPGFNLGQLKAFKIHLPPLLEQKAIARILQSLDDKIELNRQMNETLESMARALFKSWFVDFDPVIDNALAAGNPIPEPLHARAETRRALSNQTPSLSAHIKRLFPDTFHFDEEHGWIPRGWQLGPLSNVIDFLEGPGIRNWQYTERRDGCKFINIRCIKDGDLSLSTANKITKEEAFGKYSHFQLAEDDIVISTSGTLGRFAFVRAEHLPLSLNTSVVRFRTIPGASTIHYIAGYCATRLQWELETRASGSVQRNFGPMHLNKITMLAPSFQLLEAHSEIAEPLFRKGQTNLKKIDCLTKLRDTLLPQLLSGELRIPDAEQLVAGSL